MGLVTEAAACPAAILGGRHAAVQVCAGRGVLARLRGERRGAGRPELQHGAGAAALPSAQRHGPPCQIQVGAAVSLTHCQGVAIAI